MESGVYERPREKLRNIGVESLSTTELLQLIIGSGNSQVSSAKIARMVNKVMVSGQVSYENFVALPGVGDAKACLLLASLEIGRRDVRSG